MSVAVYQDEFQSREDVEREYCVQLGDHIKIIYANYLYENYSGNSIVIFRDTTDDQVYEVNGSHCSCYGLEGQWEPELVVPKELVKRPMLPIGLRQDLVRYFSRKGVPT